MNTRYPSSLPLLGLSLLFPFSLLQADEVKLKSGQSFTGRITYEADDIIKIEVPVSASIKETKVIGRADIAEIIKDAPDDVEFNRILGIVPTASLMPASAYRQLLETGPDSFLKAFPQSAHVPKVQEIRTTLAEELDKVERGFLKIEGEWLTPRDKIDFKDLIDSRIRFLSMSNLAQSGNINGLIGAMREFETIEKNYYGAPAFPKAVELAREVIPNLGRQLQVMMRDVDYRNAEYEKALANSKPEARDQLTQVRAREEKAYQEAVAADKKSGIKWVQLNPRIKASIEAYLKLATAEFARVNEFDVTVLTQQAGKLVEADQLIAAGNIEGARSKITEAAEMTGQKTDTGSKSKSKSSSKAKGGSKGGSYLATLTSKVNERTADEKSKAEARKAAAESEALTANLNKTAAAGAAEAEAAGVAAGETTAGETATEGDGTAAESGPGAPEVDDFAALAGSGKGSSKAVDEKKPAAKKSKSTSDDESDESEEDAEDEDEPKTRPAAVEEENGFPFGLIIPVITALLIVTVVLLKVFGIGGKKTEE
jgi:hypothetical protein